MGDPFDVLAEECSELIQELMKRRRFGDAGIELYVGTKPKENIIKEMGDVLALMEIVIVGGYLTKTQLIQAKQAKRARLRELFTDAP
jgi:hypothetical protein